MSANIRHVVPSQRRHFRVTVPITVSVGGIEYRTVNWSLSGFKLRDFRQPLEAGENFIAYVRIPFQGFDVGFNANAKVLRREGADEIAAQFVDLEQRGRETLDMFIHEMMRGEMAPIDGVLRRLDQPVTPVSLQPDGGNPLTPEQEAHKRQKGMRLYGIAGAVLAVVLAVVLYTNVLQMRVDTAFAMGRNDVIVSPAAGEITYIAPLNKPIAAGAPLIAVADHKLEDDIAVVDFKARNAAIQLAQLDNMMGLEKKRMTAAGGIVSKELQAASATVVSLQKNLAVKRAMIARMEGPVKQGYISGMVMDKTRSDYLDTERQLNTAREEEAKLEEEYSTVKAGFQVHDTSVQSGIHDLEEQRKSAVETLADAKAELAAMKERQERLTIHAPSTGKLVRIFTPQSGSARYGDPIAVFERNGTRVVQAFLTQQEATRIKLGQQANVHFSSLWGSVPHKVTDIDYYSLSLAQTRGLFLWQNFQNDLYKTVIVTLEPVDQAANKAMASVTPGTASTVVFNRYF